ncbi:MAG: N-acetylglucosamine-6-phosphate deacetylase [Butyrivibrio sp.]|nr:N-acetylglucosamine-6-phosphate deacetylase [Butyrivibrio sp.]
MKITGALVFGEDRKFHEKDLYVKDELITDSGAEGEEVIDASGCVAIPGLIDIHFHGAMGEDVCDGNAEAFEKIAAYEVSRGVTAMCPATLTLPVDDLKHVLSLGAEFAAKGNSKLSDLVGFNMEGPFISPVKKGAQNAEFIRKCDPGIVDEFYEASKGLLKIIGLAPEENPEFEKYIEAVSDKVVVSLAHTNSDYDTAIKAFKAGACHAVHLYNAMTGMSHREPGVVGAVFDSKHVTAELICDGIHIHPAAVRATFEMMGPERMILISDSMRSTGMPDGEYDLGGLAAIKKGREVRLKDGGAIAGSGTDLMDCLRTVVLDMGLPLEIAVAAATINPARRIGISDKYGSLEPGRLADIVLLDKTTLTIKKILRKGSPVG